jgi:hypothetical protein
MVATWYLVFPRTPIHVFRKVHLAFRPLPFALCTLL